MTPSRRDSKQKMRFITHECFVSNGDVARGDIEANHNNNLQREFLLLEDSRVAVKVLHRKRFDLEEKSGRQRE